MALMGHQLNDGSHIFVAGRPAAVMGIGVGSADVELRQTCSSSHLSIVRVSQYGLCRGLRYNRPAD